MSTSRSRNIIAEGYTGEKTEFIHDPWSDLYEALRQKTILQGRIVSFVQSQNGPTFQVDLGSDVRGVIFFEEMEVEQASLEYPASYVGSIVAFTVKHCDRRNNTVYLSRKEALERMKERTWEDLKKDAKEVMDLYPTIKAVLEALDTARKAHDENKIRAAWQELNKLDNQGKKLGPVRTCVVRWVTERGAHVDIGGVHAFLPNYELSYSRDVDARDIVQPEDAFDVKVYRVDPNTGWVQVSLKALLPDPWENVETKYVEGGLYIGKIVRETYRGFLVEVEPGIRCFVKASRLAAPPLGSDVVVRINTVDAENRRIAGSIVRIRRRAE